jgi:hypothetical protein
MTTNSSNFFKCNLQGGNIKILVFLMDVKLSYFDQILICFFYNLL